MTAPANLDALIERLNDFSCGRGCFDTLVGDCREAAAALAELRDAVALACDSEALARGTIAVQLIEIERLKMNQRCSAIEQGEVGYPCVFRAEAEAEVARLTWYKSRADDIVRYLSMKPPQITAVEAVIAELTLRAAREKL